jgi:hypothetical protein
VLDGDSGQHCLRFEPAPDDSREGKGSVPPPTVPTLDPVVRLDPRPFLVDSDPLLIEPAVCTNDEAAFGPGCVRVMDDRLYGRSPEVPMLWAIQGEGIDAVFAVTAEEPFVIAPLPASTKLTLDVTTINNRGDALRTFFSATTLPPMAHVILNEVLANPLGSEPAQEWIELVNDGSVPAELAGYVVIDVGGKTLLPNGVLAPGGFALLVNEGFMEGDDYDPAPSPGTLILHVPKLGKDGLANSGEPLKLLRSDGMVVSHFPSDPKPKPGTSVARRTPSAPDERPASFVVAQPSPGRKNTW